MGKYATRGTCKMARLVDGLNFKQGAILEVVAGKGNTLLDSDICLAVRDSDGGYVEVVSLTGHKVGERSLWTSRFRPVRDASGEVVYARYARP